MSIYIFLVVCVKNDKCNFFADATRDETIGQIMNEADDGKSESTPATIVTFVPPGTIENNQRMHSKGNNVNLYFLESAVCEMNDKYNFFADAAHDETMGQIMQEVDDGKSLYE